MPQGVMTIFGAAKMPFDKSSSCYYYSDASTGEASGAQVDLCGSPKRHTSLIEEKESNL